MAFPRVLILGSLGLFAVIGAAAGAKKIFNSPQQPVAAVTKTMPNQTFVPAKVTAAPLLKEGDFPDVNRIEQLFTTEGPTLPIVETITYVSSVPWLKGRPAWLGDYANYYSTSRHFIARSLNKKRDYSTQRLMAESKFNVFRKDKKFQFFLLIDQSKCKMGFYYLDLDTNERVLLKSYKVGLGREGSTPIGRYLVGDKIAVYRPGVMGTFQDKPMEMIRVFGTRWLPLKEVSGPSAIKGLGIHGAPWTNEKEKWVEVKKTLGAYESDGCIHMSYEDMEEVFSIVITQPTMVEIVKKIQDARLPGKEGAL